MLAYTLLITALPALAMVSDGRDGHGFVGFGIAMYPLACAYACSDSISAPLDCPTAGGEGDMTVQDSASADCKAQNRFYLQTLAYCVAEHCADEPADAIEHYWLHDAVGRPKRQPALVLSYQQALEDATKNGPPTRLLNSSQLLDFTALVPETTWQSTLDTETNFVQAETTHARYGLVLLVTGGGIPIVLSALRFLPWWPVSFVSWFYAVVLDPPLFGSRHDQSLASPFGIITMPTRGQSLFLAYLWIINIVLCAVGYDAGRYNTDEGNSWFASRGLIVLTYFANRTGVLSFANLPLVVLYAGRNNVLLWLTGWRHDTFLLLHRWIAVVAMLEAVIHSAVYLKIYLVYTGHDHAVESRLPYWYWGILATLALVLLVVLSLEPFRKRVYRWFLASHVVLSLLALVACLLHIWYRFAVQWGYETWLYIAAAVWTFDRVVRIGRWLCYGVKKAVVTSIDEDYCRVDILSFAAKEGHVYLHFPTLRPFSFLWMSHPFSVAGITRADDNSLATTFFVRRNVGLTARLVEVASSSSSSSSPSPPKNTIPVLVEGIYASNVSFLQGGEVLPAADYPNVLCIAGGVGITAVLPVLARATSITSNPFASSEKPPLGRLQLFWGVRTWPLVHAVQDVLGVSKGKSETGPCRWGPVEVELAVGQRLQLRRLLQDALRQDKHRRGGTVVVVCGPESMTDEVRCVVSGLGRHGNAVRLVVESFRW